MCPGVASADPLGIMAAGLVEAMSDTAADLLPPELVARLTKLQLASRRPLVGGLLGDHRSPRFGSSLDFSDYRAYHPGDDLRRVDMNAYARLDRLLLKLFEAEDDILVRLLVDTSGSMTGAKLQRAKQFAAAVGVVALTNRDTVALHTFPRSSRAASHGPRYIGPAGQSALMARLAGLEAAGETPFAAAALDVLARPGPPGMTVVLSDLLTSDWDQGLRRLPARRGDLVVVHVLDREDITPSFIGDLQLVDAESGATVDVSVSSAVAEDYAALAQKWLEEVAGRVRRSGAAYVRIFSDDDLTRSLMSAFTTSGVLR